MQYERGVRLYLGQTWFRYFLPVWLYVSIRCQKEISSLTPEPRFSEDSAFFKTKRAKTHLSTYNTLDLNPLIPILLINTDSLVCTTYIITICLIRDFPNLMSVCLFFIPIFVTPHLWFISHYYYCFMKWNLSVMSIGTSPIRFSLPEMYLKNLDYMPGFDAVCIPWNPPEMLEVQYRFCPWKFHSIRTTWVNICSKFFLCVECIQACVSMKMVACVQEHVCAVFCVGLFA